LGHDGWEEEGCKTAISFASFKEETCAKYALIGKSLGDRTGDCRFASASFAIQPEYMFAVAGIAPCRDLSQDFGSGTVIASSIVGIGMSVEAGSFNRPNFR
jgi:hypothetical protein